ncbi:MAG: hypothetical protein R3F43_06560 [bacterium]
MRGKGLALLVMLVGAPAAAVESFAVETAWFVPELGQAFIVGGGLEGRFSGLAGRSESPWPTRGLRLDVGWLRYADGHGRFSCGPTLGYGRSLAEPLHPDAAFQHLAFGALGRYRLASPTFFTVSFAAFAEAGPFFADAEAGTTAPRAPPGAPPRASSSSASAPCSTCHPGSSARSRPGSASRPSASRAADPPSAAASASAWTSPATERLRARAAGSDAPRGSAAVRPAPRRPDRSGPRPSR